MAITDKDQAGTGTRLLQVSATGVHSAQTAVTLTGASYTLDATHSDIFFDCTSNNIAVTFPTAVGVMGKIYRAYKIDTSTNTLTVNGTVLGGNSGNSVIVFQSNNITWKLMQLYDEGTYTATITGCTTSPTVTVSYAKNGKSITIKMPSLTATSNTTACTITGMPSHLYPSATVSVSASAIEDNSLFHPGQIDISAAGVWSPQFYSTISNITNTFTNTGIKGVGGIAFSYTMQ